MLKNSSPNTGTDSVEDVIKNIYIYLNSLDLLKTTVDNMNWYTVLARKKEMTTTHPHPIPPLKIHECQIVELVKFI